MTGKFHAHVLRLVTLCVLLGTAACRTSLNADEFIDATLGGRPGEVGGALVSDLPPQDKAAIARYVAGLESVSIEMREVVGQGNSLRLSTRQSGEEIARSFRDTSLSSRRLTDRLASLAPPDPLLKAHEGLLSAYAGYAEASAAYADAFERLDFAELRRIGSAYDSAITGLSAAYVRFDTDSNPLFRPGKQVHIPRP